MGEQLSPAYIMQRSVTAPAGLQSPSNLQQVLPGPTESLKTEGKLTGPLENLDRPLIDVDLRKSTKVFTANINAATMNVPSPHTHSKTILSTMNLRTLCLRRLRTPVENFIRHLHCILLETTGCDLFPTTAYIPSSNVVRYRRKCSMNSVMPPLHRCRAECRK